MLKIYNKCLKNSSSLLLIVLLSFFVNKGILAQNINYSIIAGSNFCQIDGDQMAGYNKLGYRFGVGAFVSLNKKDQLGMEITYTIKGSRTANNPDNPPLVIVRYNYAYAEVPIYYQKAIKGFNIKLGLAPAYLVNGRADLGFGYQKQNNLKKFDLSSILGANIKLSNQIYFYMHYQYSILNIIDKQKPQFSTFIRNGVYNNIISAGLTYQITQQ